MTFLPTMGLIFEISGFFLQNESMKKAFFTPSTLFALIYLVIGVYLIAPYVGGLVGGIDKEKANARVRNLAANVGYAQELHGEMERETDPARLKLLQGELQRLSSAR
jgi:hypothetical protein